jgi:hypothetical protein
LLTYAGTHFDPQVIGCVIRGDLLAEHQEEILTSRRSSSLTVLEEELVFEDGSPEDLRESVMNVLAVIRGHGARRWRH